MTNQAQQNIISNILRNSDNKDVSDKAINEQKKIINSIKQQLIKAEDSYNPSGNPLKVISAKERIQRLKARLKIEEDKLKYITNYKKGE